MPVRNSEIADIFDRMATLLENQLGVEVIGIAVILPILNPANRGATLCV